MKRRRSPRARSLKKLRVLVLMHEDLVPPPTLEGYSEKESAEWQTEYDVITGLKTLGHDVYMLGVGHDLAPIRDSFAETKPHIAFNLLVHFHGVAVYDQHVVSYMELLRKPYTGCNPRGLMLARDKALSKKLLAFHRIRSPRFAVFPVGPAQLPAGRQITERRSLARHFPGVARHQRRETQGASRVHARDVRRRRDRRRIHRGPRALRRGLR
jgi:hypothetical protein